VPAGLTIDLLSIIQASVSDSNTKNQVYNLALTSSDINAQFDGKDAFAFVAAMMRASGFHPNYPVVSAAGATELLDNSSVWEKVTEGKELRNLQDLKVGDILITSSGSHTMIYIGNQSFNNGKPFAMAVTSSKYPYFADASVDLAYTYNVYRRKTVPRALDGTTNSVEQTNATVNNTVGN
jgi:hypothetical protein